MLKKLLFATIMAALAANASAVVEVTVASNGSGDHTSIRSAIAAIGSASTEEAVITILDAGPFIETDWILINEATIGTRPLTIRAAEGVRPIVICEYNGDGSIYIRKGDGPLVIEDLILLPHLTVPSAAAMRIHNYTVPEGGVNSTSITLRNILIASNDGTNQPVGSLDGLTSPVITESTVSFVDEGFFFDGSSTTNFRETYMENCIVTGLNGASGSDGIRILADGSPGSEMIIGPGCVISYNNTARPNPGYANGNGAIQPGGNNGGIVIKVEGTQENPVKLINNNYNGISFTGPDGPDKATMLVKWTIIANNSLSGIKNNDPNSLNTLFENVTVVNNGEAALGKRTDHTANMRIRNSIIAGSGDPAGENNYLITTPGGTLTIDDSAIVLTGPYTLNTTGFDMDGLQDTDPSNVTKDNVITADPVFASLDPASPDFAVVTNAAYGTAGEGGQPLVGGGTFAPASVSDWQLF